MLLKQESRIWANPLYADFPHDEYERRLHRVRRTMEAQRVDVLVLWDPANIRYFSGFHSLHWSALTIQPAVLVLPLERDPVIVVPDFFSGVVQGYTYLDDIRLHFKPHVTRSIRELPLDVATLVADLGYGRGRIGLETGWQGGMTPHRPIGDIDRFRAALGEATLVEAAALIWQCRVIKSAREVDALRHATQAVVDAYSQFLGELRVGMSEREVGRRLRHAILERTEDCTPPIATASSRRVPMPDTPSFYDEVTLSQGDRLVLEPLPTFKGYYGSCCRCFQIGPLPDEALRKAEVVDAAQAAAIAAIKPGVQTKELLEVIGGTLEAGGLGSTIEMAGHGVGLNPQEPPMIAEEEEDAFAEGMAIAVEVWVVDWAGASYDGPGAAVGVPPVFGNEDLVVVTATGCEPLPSFPKDIRTLPLGV